jgi:hypothetical protein
MEGKRVLLVEDEGVVERHTGRTGWSARSRQGGKQLLQQATRISNEPFST